MLLFLELLRSCYMELPSDHCALGERRAHTPGARSRSDEQSTCAITARQYRSNPNKSAKQRNPFGDCLGIVLRNEIWFSWSCKSIKKHQLKNG